MYKIRFIVFFFFNFQNVSMWENSLRKVKIHLIELKYNTFYTYIFFYN
jgi:hypothetical protein